MLPVEEAEETKLHVHLYETMALIRAFELRVSQLYRDAAIPGFIHTSLGQEAVAAGVGAVLAGGDQLVTTHRGHGHCLAKGVDVKAALAELFGKATGVCRGRGGSMHISDPAVGALGANAIVGASVPLATGAALASKLLRKGTVAVAFFGEGAVNQGVFHESLNLAAIWELPVLLVCENNSYAEFSPSAKMTRRPNVSSAARAHSVVAVEVDGNDVEAVYRAAADAVDTCRAGGGPRLIEAHTYRWMGHYEGDPQPYKPESEAEAWRARDPLVLWRVRLEDRGVEPETLDAIAAAAAAAVDSAEEFARQSPFPTPDEAWDDVYPS